MDRQSWSVKLSLGREAFVWERMGTAVKDWLVAYWKGSERRCKVGQSRIGMQRMVVVRRAVLGVMRDGGAWQLWRVVYWFRVKLSNLA